MASLNSVLHRLASYLHPDDPVHQMIDEVAPVEKGEEESADAAE
jgi:hypothetical protein